MKRRFVLVLCLCSLGMTALETADGGSLSDLRITRRTEQYAGPGVGNMNSLRVSGGYPGYENIGSFSGNGNGNGNSGSFNGNGNTGNFNGNGNTGNFNGNANCGSGNGNRFSSDGNGNGQGVPEWCGMLKNLNGQLGLPPGTIPDFE